MSHSVKCDVFCAHSLAILFSSLELEPVRIASSQK